MNKTKPSRFEMFLEFMAFLIKAGALIALAIIFFYYIGKAISVSDEHARNSKTESSILTN